ncbi:hypothetical protein D0T84_17820 [Dysgonomonas sp. 521]|nr:hypothetical protein [Dysgonomonas sp. 521]
MGILFLGFLIISSYITYYVISTFVLFSVENSKVGKAGCNPLLDIVKSKTPNWVYNAFAVYE